MKLSLSFFIGLFFLIQTAVQAENLKLKISPTLQLSSTQSFDQKAQLINLNTHYLTKKDSYSKKQELFIITYTPPTVANLVSIQRLWNEARQKNSTQTHAEKNHSCEKITSWTYSCSREITQQGKFISEKLFWNAKNDLILIRSTSLTSTTEARQIIETLKLDSNQRKPAQDASAPAEAQ